LSWSKADIMDGALIGGNYAPQSRPYRMRSANSESCRSFGAGAMADFGTNPSFKVNRLNGGSQQKQTLSESVPKQ
jgi:hypothetical protein